MLVSTFIMEVALMVTCKRQIIKFCTTKLDERWFLTTVLCWNTSKILLNYNKFWNTCNFFQPRLQRLTIGLRVVNECYFNTKSCTKDKQLKARNNGSEIFSVRSLRQPYTDLNSSLYLPRDLNKTFKIS